MLLIGIITLANSYADLVEECVQCKNALFGKFCNAFYNSRDLYVELPSARCQYGKKFIFPVDKCPPTADCDSCCVSISSFTTCASSLNIDTDKICVYDLTILYVSIGIVGAIVVISLLIFVFRKFSRRKTMLPGNYNAI